jgi:hypothetical protein
MVDQLPHPWLPIGKLLPKSLKEAICRLVGMTAIITGEKKEVASKEVESEEVESKEVM